MTLRSFRNLLNGFPKHLEQFADFYKALHNLTHLYLFIYLFYASLVAQMVKSSDCHAGDPGSIHGSGKIPWRRKWHPTPVLLPGKFCGWKNLVGYSPWGGKQSDTTERLHSLSFQSLLELTFFSSTSCHTVLLHCLK